MIRKAFLLAPFALAGFFTGCTQQSFVILSAVKNSGDGEQPSWIILNAGNPSSRSAIRASEPIARLPPGNHYITDVLIVFGNTIQQPQPWGKIREPINLRTAHLRFTTEPGVITWIGAIHLESTRDTMGNSDYQLAIRQNNHQVRLACRKQALLFKEFSVKKLTTSGDYEIVEIDCNDYD